MTRYQRVYAVVRRIPRGRVTTYGAIARLARCTGARQAGYALSALDEHTPVPWHRVVNARGAISLPGPSGVTQRLRLEREGVRFNSRGLIDLAAFGWHSQSGARRGAPGRHTWRGSSRAPRRSR